MSIKQKIQTNLAEYKQKWNEIDPSQRRIYMAASVVFILVVVVLYMGSKKEEALKTEREESVSVKDEIKTDKLVAPKVGELGVDGIVGLTQNEMERQRSEQEALVRNQEQIANDYREGNQVVGQTVSDLSRQLAAVSDQVKQMQMGTQSGGSNGINLPPLQGLDGNSGMYAQPPVDQNHKLPVEENLPTESTVTRPVEVQQQSDPFQIIRSGKDVSNMKSMNGYRDSTTTNAATQNLNAQAKLYLKRTLPSGSMMQGVLINGMDATAGRGKGGAVPALVRIKKNAVLPNRYNQLVKECFVIVSGVGNLATERAEMRAENLSCVFKDGEIIDAPISAYVVGEDGKTGMRGRVVSKQGSIIAKSMIAGFLGGFGKQVAPQSVPSLDISGGSKTQYQMPNLGDASQNAMAMGLGNGLDRVSNFYMDLAEQMVPVIEIDAGRQVTLILNSKFEPKQKAQG